MAHFKEAETLSHYWRVEWEGLFRTCTTTITRAKARAIRKYLREKGIKSEMYKVYFLDGFWIQEKTY